MAPQAVSITYALSQFAQHGDAPLRIHFPDITVTKPGASVTRATAAQQPTLSVSSTMVKIDPSKNYLAIMLDLDAPYPSVPMMGPIAHAIHAHLRPVSQEEVMAGGWLKLEATTAVAAAAAAVQKHEKTKKPVLPYLAPAPPPLSAPHRYLVLVWEQPGDLTSTQEIKRLLKLPAEEEVGMMARVKWDLEGFENKLGLGTVLAGTYFVC